MSRVSLPLFLLALLLWIPACGDGSTGVDDPVCGDGVCEGDETLASCADDCTPRCGDDVCQAPTEDKNSCLRDCGAPEVCGNLVCEAAVGETETSCPTDCVPCGDDYCDKAHGESAASCAADCAPKCGDGVCTHNETRESCAQDCDTDPVCGDGFCSYYEDRLSCNEDCANMCNEELASATLGKPCGDQPCDQGSLCMNTDEGPKCMQKCYHQLCELVCGGAPCVPLTEPMPSGTHEGVDAWVCAP